jgi:hypothetical protein
MGMTCTVAIGNVVKGVINGVGAREIGGEIESCLKLEARVSNERIDNSECSVKGVDGLGESMLLVGVELISVGAASRRRV